MAHQDSRKIHEQVADEFRRRIVTGELEVGERLPSEEELTQKFGIARTTLREALRVLESQGLIEIRRGRGGGPVVTEPNLEHAATALAISLQMQGTTLRDLDEARSTMEAHAARRLAETHRTEDIEALNKAITFAVSHLVLVMSLSRTARQLSCSLNTALSDALRASLSRLTRPSSLRLRPCGMCHWT